jgi:hypothetical protein
MGEFSAPVTEEHKPAITISNRRILIEMAVIIGIGILAGLLAVSLKFSIGVLIGGILAFVNYLWLESSLRGLFAHVAAGGRPGLPAIRYILRYLVIGGVLWLVYLTGAGSMVGAILGLASFAFAVVIEGFISIFSGFLTKGI